MEQKEYVVPDGMYEAAMKHQDSAILCGAALRAAIQWLAENPIQPTDEQMDSITNEVPYQDSGNGRIFRIVIDKWQRRMFLKPEPRKAQVPPGLEEAFAQRLRMMQFQGDPRRQELLEVFADIYRRGFSDGENNGRS